MGSEGRRLKKAPLSSASWADYLRVDQARLQPRDMLAATRARGLGNLLPGIHAFDHDLAMVAMIESAREANYALRQRGAKGFHGRLPK
jgi:hypothetical protein